MYVKITTSQGRVLVVFLGALTALGPLSVDLYLPAMPGMAGQLDASAASVQLSLTAFVVGLALGQLVLGPWSDAVGRRMPLLVGLVAYVVGSLGCVLAPSVQVLLIARVLQSVGAAAGVVVARAVVRDLFEGPAMTRFFSSLMLVNGIAPVVAPVVGGQVLQVVSWRALFGGLAVVGVVLWVLVAVLLGESLPRDRRRSGGLAATRQAFAHLLRDGRYVRSVLVGSLGFGMMFVYIASSSFVLQDGHGLSPVQFSLVFGVNGLGIVLGGQLNSRLVGRVADEARLLAASLVVAALGASVVLAAALLDAPLAVTLVALFVAIAAMGPILANVASLAMADHGAHAGSAASLLGAAQFAGAGLAPVLASGVAVVVGDAEVAMGLTMLVLAATGAGLARRLVRPAVLVPTHVAEAGALSEAQ